MGRESSGNCTLNADHTRRELRATMRTQAVVTIASCDSAAERLQPRHFRHYRWPGPPRSLVVSAIGQRRILPLSHVAKVRQARRRRTMNWNAGDHGKKWVTTNPALYNPV